MTSLFSNDIQKLNTLYSRHAFSFTFLYGRSGTGKTTLVRDFCHGRRTIFFSARQTEPIQQLHFFWQDCMNSLEISAPCEPFASWEQAFAWVSSQSFQHRLILVLDEFQILAQHSDSFCQAFQNAVHHDFQAGKVFLITTCSSLTFAAKSMENPVLEPYTQITARADLGPVSFYTCQQLLSPYEFQDQLLLYGITGGLAPLLSSLRAGMSAKDNIIHLFFRSNSPNLMLPQTLLRQDLREVATYNRLMELVACGNTRLIDIATAANIGTNKCAKYLSVLIEMGYIKKEFPSVGELKKKVRYLPADHMLQFWYRFVYPNLSGILFGRGEEIYKTRILPFVDEFLEAVLETVCAEYMERLGKSEDAPFPYNGTGPWWQGGTKCEPFFRIPLVATDERHAVLGICHWAEEPAGLPILESLRQIQEPFEKLTRYYCIFSGSGFSQALLMEAQTAGNVWLIDAKDICE